MAPSDSRELLYIGDSSNDLEICAPVNPTYLSDSTLDLPHLQTICVSKQWSQSESVTLSSDDSTETAEVMEPLELKDKTALGGDLRFILTMPEMCDVKFLVGRRKFPMYAVKAILAARSSTFMEMIAEAQNTDTSHKWKGRAWVVSQIKKLARKDQPRVRSPLILEIPDFEPTIFRHVLNFAQTGDISVKFDDVIGVMNAADVYGLDALRSTCLGFARRSITSKAVLGLQASTQSFTSYKWTKLIRLEILKFVCDKAQDILQQTDFQKLSQETAILVLSKPELRATEEVKWDAVLRWSVHNGGDMSDKDLRDVLLKLSSGINFCDIPLSILTREIRSLGFLPDDVINKAVSYQKSPRLIIGQENTTSESPRRRPTRSRGKCRVTVPDIPLTENYFHMQPLASSTFDSSRDFTDSLQSCDSL